MSAAPYPAIGVVGAGAWGTALALVAHAAGRKVTLWAREPEVAAAVAEKGENSLFLPGIPLPPELSLTRELAGAVQAGAVLVVVPAQHIRTMLREMAGFLRPGTPLVLCAKGIEGGSGLLLPEVLAEELPQAVPGVLSGPSFARDVARGLPTAVTVAAPSLHAARLQASLAGPALRPYSSDDVIGAAIGGAAKNVYAIGCGIVEGSGLGESARAALLARSFAEMYRLGLALGARRETLMGLSGLGDLVLSATSPTSRNFALGVALGRGDPLNEALGTGKPLAEGAATAPALMARAAREGVELPIAEAVAGVLSGALSAGEAIEGLMARPLRAE